MVSPRLIVVLIFAALLAGVLYTSAQFGGARVVSFARRPGRGRRSQSIDARGNAGISETVTDLDLSEIGKIPDRRAAVTLLAQRALGKAAEVNGLRIARSWTMRDTLRRLPKDWPQLPALQQIAAAYEISHFGGRAVTEDSFQSLLGLTRTIIVEEAR